MKSVILVALLALAQLTTLGSTAFAAKASKALSMSEAGLVAIDQDGQPKSSVKSKSKPAAKSKGESKAKGKDGSTLSRDLVFDGSNVDGRYHSAGEAVARVESEKQLNELIGMRKNFRDRLGAERERLKREGK